MIRKHTSSGIELIKLYFDNKINAIGFNKFNQMYVGFDFGTYKVLKLGYPRKEKIWIADVEQTHVSVRTLIKCKTFIYINGVMRYSNEENETHEFQLSADDFSVGANQLKIEISNQGYELYKVTRDGQRLEVTQWVMSNEEALPLEVELTLTGEGKLHKYIGAIG